MALTQFFKIARLDWRRLSSSNYKQVRKGVTEKFPLEHSWPVRR